MIQTFIQWFKLIQSSINSFIQWLQSIDSINSIPQYTPKHQKTPKNRVQREPPKRPILTTTGKTHKIAKKHPLYPHFSPFFTIFSIKNHKKSPKKPQNRRKNANKSFKKAFNPTKTIKKGIKNLISIDFLTFIRLFIAFKKPSKTLKIPPKTSLFSASLYPIYTYFHIPIDTPIYPTIIPYILLYTPIYPSKPYIAHSGRLYIPLYIQHNTYYMYNTP